ncbi:cation acetate symporter [Streptomyces anandii]|uniref:solute symporter family protein n=1 Tax=Streptomyces anandii TaxID=285454 RepID=UPI00370130FB
MTTTALTSTNSHFPVFAVFVTFVCCALFVTVLVTTDRTTPRDFYIGDGRLTPVRNGIAIFGVYLSVETLLGAPGRIALTGYDGIGYLMGPIVGIAVVLLVIAEPYHSISRYTVGDSLGRRLRTRSVHVAAGIATLGICLVYLIAQLVGAGALAAPILGLEGSGARAVMVGSLGVLVIIYAALGGMWATTAIQVVKGVLLLAGGGLSAVLIMSRVGWDPSNLLSQAADHSGLGDAFLRPGTSHTDTAVDKLDSLSVQLAVFIGAVGMPHVLMRLRAVSTARAARRSVEIAAWLTLAFCLMAGLIGFGAATLLGRAAIITDNPTGNTAVLMLAKFIGGAFLITLISCLAFATVLAVVSGLVLTASAALAHDIYQVGLMRGKASEKSELLVARIALVLVGLVGIGLSLYAQAQSISFLVGLALAIAGSAILPAVLYNMYWRRFTTRGALWSVYGGLLSSVLLVVFSPVLSGSPTSLLPDLDFAVFPLTNPAVVSIPLGFLLGLLGSVLGSRKSDGTEYAETEAGVLADVADGAPEASPGP